MWGWPSSAPAAGSLASPRAPEGFPPAFASPCRGYLYVDLLEVEEPDLEGGGAAGPVACSLLQFGREHPRDRPTVRVSCPCLQAPLTSEPAEPCRDREHSTRRRSSWTPRGELLGQCFDYCGASALTLELLRRGEVVASGSLPLRAASPLASLDTVGGGRAAGGAGGGGSPADASATAKMDKDMQLSVFDEAEAHPLPPERWLRKQELWLTPAAGSPGAVGGVGGAVCRTSPCLRFRLLHLLDIFLPPLLGGQNPFHKAISEGAVKLVKAFLRVKIHDAMTPSEQAACVDLAVEQGQHEALSLLLDFGFDVFPSALEIAVRGGPGAGVVRQLLRCRGPALLRVGEGGAAPSALSSACLHGNIEAVNAILQVLEAERASLEGGGGIASEPLVVVAGTGGVAVGGQGGPLLRVPSPWQQPTVQATADPPVICCIRGCRPRQRCLEMLRMLTSAGFGVNARSCLDGATALHFACELGDVRILQELLARGARQVPTRATLFTPLHLACTIGHWHLVGPLTAALAELQPQGGGAGAGASGAAQRLNSLDAYGRTALDVCVARYLSSITEDSDPSAAKRRLQALRAAVTSSEGLEVPSLSVSCSPHLMRCGEEILETLVSSKSTISLECPEPAARGPLVEALGGGSDASVPEQQADPYEPILRSVAVLHQAGGLARRSELPAPTTAVPEKMFTGAWPSVGSLDRCINDGLYLEKEEEEEVFGGEV